MYRLHMRYDMYIYMHYIYLIIYKYYVIYSCLPAKSDSRIHKLQKTTSRIRKLQKTSNKKYKRISRVAKFGIFQSKYILFSP